MPTVRHQCITRTTWVPDMHGHEHDEETGGADPLAVLRNLDSIAMVGASPRPVRPSHQIMAFLLARGYEVFPIHPGLAGKEILGRRVFASLAELPQPVEMIDIFRNAEGAGKVVDEALALPWRPKVIWMQLGIINKAAAEKARAAGITVIMNRCPKMV